MSIDNNKRSEIYPSLVPTQGPVKEGSSRIQLVEGGEISVAYKEIPKKLTRFQAFKQLFMPLLYVKTEDSQNKKNIWISVSSVAKSLGISRIAARKLIKKAGVAGLEKEATDKKIVDNFIQKAEGLRKRKKLVQQSLYETIRKVLTTASRLPANVPSLVKEGNYTFRVTKDEKGKIGVAAQVEKLGQGGFKVVSKYVTLATAKTFALMKAKVQKQSTTKVTRATQAIQAEGAILDAIYAKRETATSLPGLQAKPHAVYVITKAQLGSSEEIGFMEADLYDGGDLDMLMMASAKMDELTVTKKLEICQQLAEGCETLHNMGIVHRDIKPDNIMLKLGSDGRVKEANIIDFGLSTIVDKSKFESNTGKKIDEKPYSSMQEKAHNWAGTRTYATIGDRKVSGEKVDTTRRELRYKQDIFGLGRTFIELMIKKNTYFKMPNGEDSRRAVSAVDIDGIRAGLKESNVPPDLIEVLIRAVSINPSTRPTANEMVEAIKSALKQSVAAAE